MIHLHPRHRFSDNGLERMFVDLFFGPDGATRAIQDQEAGFGRDNTIEPSHPQHKVYEQTYDILEKAND